MNNRSLLRRLVLALAAGTTLAIAGIAVPVGGGGPTPAIAQSADDFNAALDAYGHWVRLAPYGEVWVPDGVPRGWRPYEYGHWVYTDEWGWYWVSDDEEADWGWVVYHYGRWIHDRESWFWVPGDEWAPAWVDWRYGGDDIGWAPMPPDDMVDAYDDDAEYWSFVPLRYIGEPELRRHYVPRDRRIVILRETHIINRPVHIEGRRVWVNPGLSPGFIAGRTHVALHAYNVRPRVFGATAGVQGGITVRPQELHGKGAVRRIAPVTIQRTTTAIAPTTNATPPKPLGKGERGQLGSQPPRAAQGTVAPSKQGPAGVPPPKGPAAIQPGTAPAVKPATPPTPPKVTIPERHEERRVVTPPGAGASPKPNVVPPPSPPKQPTPPVHTPPPQVHAPPPPQVHVPPPAAHAPPPPAATRAPAPQSKAPPPKGPLKPGEKPPEPPK